MPVNFQEIQNQIKEMGKQAPEREKLLKEKAERAWALLQMHGKAGRAAAAGGGRHDLLQRAALRRSAGRAADAAQAPARDARPPGADRGGRLADQPRPARPGAVWRHQRRRDSDDPRSGAARDHPEQAAVSRRVGDQRRPGGRRGGGADARPGRAPGPGRTRLTRTSRRDGLTSKYRPCSP